METLFGLPAHALIVHAPIVLLPIAAIATIALAVRPAWRHRAHWWMIGALFSVVAMLFLAKNSGEAFEAALQSGQVGRHEDLANTTFILTLLWFVAYTALVGYEFFQGRNVPSTVGAAGDPVAPVPAVTYGLAALSAVLAILATIWLIRTGHEGTNVVWGPTSDQIFD